MIEKKCRILNAQRIIKKIINKFLYMLLVAKVFSFLRKKKKEID